ncbi:type II/IV secretion system protein [bacterium]|nr:type II/IV secretion system protein [candidate division CSSED10-310 bacterium]
MSLPKMPGGDSLSPDLPAAGGMPDNIQSGFTRRIPDPAIGADIPSEFFKLNRLIPVSRDSTGHVVVVAADPLDTIPLDMLAAYLGVPIVVSFASDNEIRRMILDRTAALRKSATQILQDSGRYDQPGDAAGRQPKELIWSGADESAVVRLVNTVITEAVDCRASDIHFEPERNGVRIRYRIDGLLQDALHSPDRLKEYLVSRIKVMAGMDISRRHQPQDGSLSVTVKGNPMDIRISAVPTPFGERLVLRLLGRHGLSVDLAGLGMTRETIQSVDAILAQTSGMLIVAGPTGSGKTTTLYACLNRLDAATRNIITIEDPVEYQVPGVSQVQVGGKQSMGFADGLRSMLRQDPDIMMVGEIRDTETASIALRSALTGHLILTTIHTGSPDGAVMRLLDLGADRALICETISGIIEQRLIRLSCPECSARRSESPAGCPECRYTGFKGRTGLFRLVRFDEDVKDAVRRENMKALKTILDRQSRSTLRIQAEMLAETGQTTSAEVLRVLGDRPETRERE